MKQTQSQLDARLAQAAAKVEIGARYVVYQAEYGAHAIWVRPLKNWLEMVEVDGKMVPRFKKL